MTRDKLPSQDSRLNHMYHIREDVQAWHLDLAVSEATVQPKTDSLGIPQEGHPKAPKRQCLLRRGQNWGPQGRGQPLSPELGFGGDAELLGAPQPSRCDCWLGGEGRPGVEQAWVSRAHACGPSAREEALPEAGRGYPASEGPSS